MAVKHTAKGKNLNHQGLSEDTKTVLVVMLLIFAYPAGLILMFLWMKWPSWVKILVLLPVLIFVLAMGALVLLVTINPRGKIERAERARCVQLCRNDTNYCYEKCLRSGR